jgi:hypothetical protein
MLVRTRSIEDGALPHAIDRDNPTPNIYEPVLLIYNKRGASGTLCASLECPLLADRTRSPPSSPSRNNPIRGAPRRTRIESQI